MRASLDISSLFRFLPLTPPSCSLAVRELLGWLPAMSPGSGASVAVIWLPGASLTLLVSLLGSLSLRTSSPAVACPSRSPGRLISCPPPSDPPSRSSTPAIAIITDGSIAVYPLRAHRYRNLSSRNNSPFSHAHSCDTTFTCIICATKVHRANNSGSASRVATWLRGA